MTIKNLVSSNPTQVKATKLLVSLANLAVGELAKSRCGPMQDDPINVDI